MFTYLLVVLETVYAWNDGATHFSFNRVTGVKRKHDFPTYFPKYFCKTRRIRCFILIAEATRLIRNKILNFLWSKVVSDTTIRKHILTYSVFDTFSVNLVMWLINFLFAWVKCYSHFKRTTVFFFNAVL